MLDLTDRLGKMVLIAGPNLGESWFTKEIGQALVQLEGTSIWPWRSGAEHQILDKKSDDSVES